MRNTLIRALRRVTRSDVIDALNASLAETIQKLETREQAHLDFARVRDDQLAQLSRDLAERREIAENLVRKVDETQAERDGLTGRLNAIIGDKNALEQRLAESVIRLEMRERAHLDFARVGDEQLAHLEIELKIATERLEAREQAHLAFARVRDDQLVALQEEVGSIAGERDELGQKAATIGAEIDRLRDCLDAAQLARDEAIEERRQLGDALTALSAAFEALRMSTEKAEAAGRIELDLARAEVAALRSEAEASQAAMRKTDHNLKEWQTDTAAKLEAMSVKAQTHLEEAAATAAMVGRTQSELDLAIQQLGAARDEIERLGRSELALIAERDGLRAALTSFSQWRAPESVEAELASVRQSLTTEMNAISAERDECAAERNSALADREKLHQQNQLMECEVREAEVSKRLARTIGLLRANGARRRLIQSLLLNPVTGVADRRAVFTLHKTASSFVWNLMSYLADVLNLPVHSANASGAEYLSDEINIRSNLGVVNSLSGLFGPFRGYVDFPADTFSRSIVILRDPRDVLVSLYYSWTYSHPIESIRLSLVNSKGELFNPTPEQRDSWKSAGPDDFVLEYAGFVEKNIRLYLEKVLPRPGARLLLYEHFVANQSEWLRRFLVALGAGEADAEWLLPGILEHFSQEFLPPTEDKNRHIRQMLPGDHQRKLTPSTISLLDKRFAFYFEALDAQNGVEFIGDNTAELTTSAPGEQAMARLPVRSVAQS
ncbi:MAG: hypothetical protein Q8R44_10775 [Novosphingobium sp.]|nr:hypothetical protein [Novosphingobium sp.]